MKLRSTLTKLAAVVFTGALATGLAAAPAQAAPVLGTQSLATVLTSDGDQFDTNWSDYDIVTEAVLAVLGAKPSSSVGLLTQGGVALTAFIPTDRAFRHLAHDLTGKWLSTEEKVFNKLVAKLGVDAIESVLLYHVVAGGPIMAADALQADGVRLTTALGKKIKVDVRGTVIPKISLIDRDFNSADARVNPWQTDINEGNMQVAHGITKVLRPMNLPG